MSTDFKQSEASVKPAIPTGASISPAPAPAGAEASAGQASPPGDFVWKRKHLLGLEDLSAEEIMAILGDFSPLVEPVSVDEAFVDLTGTESLFGAPADTVQRIKQRIREATGLGASAGLASNKFIAKIASDLRKPDGLVIVPPGREAAFLAPLPVERLWGVGKATARSLAAASSASSTEMRSAAQAATIAPSTAISQASSMSSGPPTSKRTAISNIAPIAPRRAMQRCDRRA